MKHARLIVVAISLVALPVVAQTYRWVDSNGEIHYSSIPPKSGQVEKIKTPTATKINDTDVEKQTIKDEKVKAQAEKQAVFNKQAQQKAAQNEAQLKQACDGMRKDLALYQNYPRARVDVDGQTRRLTPEELNKRITDLQKTTNDRCQGY